MGSMPQVTVYFAIVRIRSHPIADWLDRTNPRWSFDVARSLVVVATAVQNLDLGGPRRARAGHCASRVAARQHPTAGLAGLPQTNPPWAETADGRRHPDRPVADRPTRLGPGAAGLCGGALRAVLWRCPAGPVGQAPIFSSKTWVNTRVSTRRQSQAVVRLHLLASFPFPLSPFADALCASIQPGCT